MISRLITVFKRTHGLDHAAQPQRSTSIVSLPLRGFVFAGFCLSAVPTVFATTCNFTENFTTSESTGATLAVSNAGLLEDACSVVFTRTAGTPTENGSFIRTNQFQLDEAQELRAFNLSFLLDPSNMQFSGTTGGERRGRVLDIRKPQPETGGSLLFQMLVRDENGQFQGNVKWVGDTGFSGRCTNSWFNLNAGSNEIEIGIELADPGQSNGICTISANGALVQQQTNLTNGNQTLSNLRIGHIRGFAQSAAGSFVIDHIRLTETNGDFLAYNDFDPTVTGGRGGSVYNIFQVDIDEGGPGLADDQCNWLGNTGVVKSYHLGTQKIHSDLERMRADGQKRIAFSLFHGDYTDGIVVESTPAHGISDSQYYDNLEDLLITVEQMGFVEVRIGFQGSRKWGVGGRFPATLPDIWTTDAQEVLDNNWQVIQQIRDFIATLNLNLNVYYDLHGELILAHGSGGPYDPFNYIVSEYGRRLWSLNRAKYGVANTIGFSVAATGANDIEKRIAHMDYIYDGNPPYVFGFSMYYGAPQAVQTIDQELALNGYSQGFVITETFYNDAQNAASLASAISGLSRTVYAVNQWQRSSKEHDKESSCFHFDVDPPMYYSEYIAAGL